MISLPINFTLDNLFISYSDGISEHNVDLDINNLNGSVFVNDLIPNTLYENININYSNPWPN